MEYSFVVRFLPNEKFLFKRYIIQTKGAETYEDALIKCIRLAKDDGTILDIRWEYEKENNIASNNTGKN